MIIAVDAAGGDYAPHEVVKGAIQAAHEFGIEIVLVGRKNVLRKLAEKSVLEASVNIVDAKQVIDFNEHPMKALQTKPQSSILVGIGLVKSGEADAFVSAGNTGAVVGGAMLTLGRVPGVSRPAIGCFLDTLASHPSLLVDAGANADCRPEHLLEFARLGALYSKSLLKIFKPKVGLLSIGGEEGKGNKLAQESYQLLKEAPDLKFAGNVEGHDLIKRTVDVIVTDGFTGNIVLKLIEGFSDNYLNSLRQVGHVFSSVAKLKTRDLMKDIGLAQLTKRMDYTEYGGACLLGVNGNIIIAHGRSQAKAIKNAIGLARSTVEGNITQKLKEERNNGQTG
jgi:glycerol-3-phosphate acyltransferase PlsX